MSSDVKIAAGIFLVGSAGCLAWYLSWPTPEEMKAEMEKQAAARSFGLVEASVMCRQAIRLVSRDPERATVPMVDGYTTKEEFAFVWGPATKLARLHNGLSLEVGVSAACTADRQTGKINSLVVNGSKII